MGNIVTATNPRQFGFKELLINIIRYTTVLVNYKIKPLIPLAILHTNPLVMKFTHSTNRSYLCVLFGYKFGRDSSDVIVTRYGMDGPGIEFRLGRDFSYPSRPALGPTQPPIQWSIPVVK